MFTGTVIVHAYMPVIVLFWEGGSVMHVVGMCVYCTHASAVFGVSNYWNLRHEALLQWDNYTTTTELKNKETRLITYP